jgi:hypothetical protein
VSSTFQSFQSDKSTVVMFEQNSEAPSPIRAEHINPHAAAVTVSNAIVQGIYFVCAMSGRMPQFEMATN